ncbi:hypothetical protein K501DRAFT_258818 [Backusella circina FSU 941]|nr:hypothetical protein K501DRAFT_258818 [Backusella circina FSU 941]
MRSYIAAAGALAIAATAANAADCNPSYNVASAGTCINDCNLNAAKTFDSQWTYDSTSEHFIASLALMCDKAKSGSLYTAFMSQAGMCMTACTSDEQSAFFAQYDGACAWYTAHINDVCADSTSTSTSSNATSSSTTSSNTTSSNTTSSNTAASTGTGSPSSSGSTGSTGSSSSGSKDATSSSSANNEAASSSTSGAGKIEFGAITVAAVAFAAFIAL